MHMFRKLLIAAGAVAMSAGAVALTTTGASAAPQKAVTFKGSISCALSGSVTAAPPVTNTAQTIKFTIKGTVSGCKGKTSQGGVKITGGTISGSVKTASETCTSVVGSPPEFAGSIAWKATGGTAAPTAYKLSAGDATSTSPLTITYTSTQTGSFAGKGSLTAVVKQSVDTLLSECGSTGVKTLTLTKGSKVS
jgi:hypothetical protein